MRDKPSTAIKNIIKNIIIVIRNDIIIFCVIINNIKQYKKLIFYIK